MAKRRRKIANTVADPTLPKVPIEIQGKEYYLCFDLGALAEAKQHFAMQGHRVNVLVALSDIDIDSLMVLLPCALRKHHPELSFEDAQKLASLPVLFQLSGAILRAWNESMPIPKRDDAQANPPRP